MSETVESGVTEEVRLSVVLYGGVSLAVYMAGVCEELLNLVRATSVGEAHDQTPRPGGFLQYQKAARLEAAEWASAQANLNNLDRRPVKRRVVVDVLSGSSAGGLNALFLSRALIGNLGMEVMRDLLVEQGDLLMLLDDEQVDDKLPQDAADGPARRKLKPTDPPKSLLSGDRFAQLLYRGLRDQGVPGTSLVEALDCYMTMTDLRGMPETTTLSDGISISELRHRAVAHLQYGTKQSTGLDRNDFFSPTPEDQARPNRATRLPDATEGFISFVGRSTAAHPAAFAPSQMIHHRDHVIPETTSFEPSDARWSRLITPRYEPADLAHRWFSDGGDLDNKPFTHAIDPVLDRRSDVLVDRKIVYVEPDPSEPSEDHDSWNMPGLWSYTAGAFALGRQEGIRQDLARIEARNRTVMRLRTAIGDILDRVADKQPMDSAPIRAKEADREQRIDEWVDGADTWMPQRPYELARERGLVETLVEWIAGLSGVDPTRLTEVVRAELPNNHRRVLIDHDLGYRLRRLNMIDQVLSVLLSPADQRGVLSDWEEAQPAEAQRAVVVALRRELNAIYLRIATCRRLLELRDLDETATVVPNAHEIRATLPPLIEAVRGAAAMEQARRSGAGQAAPVNDTALRSAVEALLEARRDLVEPVLEDASRAAREVLQRPSTPWRVRLVNLWEQFDNVDQLLLPLYDETRGEIDPIEVVRFSPVDATSLIDNGTAERNGPDWREKLGGAAVHHFGGFFDRNWRQSDILWGRLDAAELLIKTLLPLDTIDDERATFRAELIEKAQIAILEEEADALPSLGAVCSPALEWPQNPDPHNVREFLKSEFDVSLSLNEPYERHDRKAELLARGSVIVGGMLAAANIDPDVPAEASPRSATAIRRAGQVTNAVIQLTMPAAVTPKLVRFLALPALAVAAALSAILIYPASAREYIVYPLAGVAVIVVAKLLATRLRPRATRADASPGARDGPPHDTIPLSERVTGATGRSGLLGNLLTCIINLLIIGGLVLLVYGLFHAFSSDISDGARAWLYTVIGFALAHVATVVLTSGRVNSPRLRGMVGLSMIIASLGSLVGAAIVDWTVAALVVASSLTSALAIGIYLGLVGLQGMIERFGDVPPDRATDAQIRSDA